MNRLIGIGSLSRIASNLRQHLNEFLHQVRLSKGYDVEFDFLSKDVDPVKAELYCDLFDHPSTEYVARDLKEEKVSDLANCAVKAALGELNQQMKKAELIRRHRGKMNYELLSVDKLVSAVNHLQTNLEWLFFTLTASEKMIISETETKTMCTVILQVLAVIVLDRPSPDTFRLYQWGSNLDHTGVTWHHLPK